MELTFKNICQRTVQRLDSAARAHGEVLNLLLNFTTYYLLLDFTTCSLPCNISESAAGVHREILDVPLNFTLYNLLLNFTIFIGYMKQLILRLVRMAGYSIFR